MGIGNIIVDRMMIGVVVAMLVVALIAYLSGVNVYLIAIVLCVSLYYLFITYVESSKRLSRVNLLNRQLESLGGYPIDDVGFLIESSVYKELVSGLERSILDILIDAVVDEHVKVLLRKKAQRIYADDYGREIDDEWLSELVYFAKNIFMPSLDGVIRGRGLIFEEIHIDLNVRDKFSVEYWVDVIDLTLACKQGGRSKVAAEFEIEFELDDVVSGHDYEYFVSGLIGRVGWLARVTSASGDHGADVIAELNGVRVAVQCKFFSGSVGNKSVQEAYSAKDFYDCGHACVVTNSSYTPAARKAAAKLGVALLHHSDIESYFQSISL